MKTLNSTSDPTIISATIDGWPAHDDEPCWGGIGELVVCNGRLWGSENRMLDDCRGNKFPAPFHDQHIIDRVAALTTAYRQGYELILRVTYDDVNRCAKWWKDLPSSPAISVREAGPPPLRGIRLGLIVNGDDDLYINVSYKCSPIQDCDTCMTAASVGKFCALPGADTLIWSGEEPLTHIPSWVKCVVASRVYSHDSPSRTDEGNDLWNGLGNTEAQQWYVRVAIRACAIADVPFILMSP